MLARGEREINQLLLKFVCCRFAFVFLRPPPVFLEAFETYVLHIQENRCVWFHCTVKNYQKLSTLQDPRETVKTIGLWRFIMFSCRNMSNQTTAKAHLHHHELELWRLRLASRLLRHLLCCVCIHPGVFRTYFQHVKSQWLCAPDRFQKLSTNNDGSAKPCESIPTAKNTVQIPLWIWNRVGNFLAITWLMKNKLHATQLIRLSVWCFWQRLQFLVLQLFKSQAELYLPERSRICLWTPAQGPLFLARVCERAEKSFLWTPWLLNLNSSGLNAKCLCRSNYLQFL